MLNKKFVFFQVCSLIVVSIFLPTAAMAVNETLALGEESMISIQYIYINHASTSLTVSSDGKATIYGYVQRTPFGKSIYLVSTLQRYSSGVWIDVKSWVQFSMSSSAFILETYQVSGGTYRVKTYYYVTGVDGAESGTVYSKNATY